MFLSWNAATTGFLSAPALSNSRVVMGIRKCHHSAPSHRVARRKWVKPQFRAKYPFKVCQRLFWSGNSRPAAGVEQRRWAEVFCWFLLWIRRQTRGPLAPPATLLYSSGLWSVSFLLLIWLLSVCVCVCGGGGGQRMGNEMGSEKWKMDALVCSHRENCLPHSSADDDCHPQVSTLLREITVALSQRFPQRSADSQICSDVIRLMLADFEGKTIYFFWAPLKIERSKRPQYFKTAAVVCYHFSLRLFPCSVLPGRFVFTGVDLFCFKTRELFWFITLLLIQHIFRTPLSL